jgi:primary-amine oxidase
MTAPARWLGVMGVLLGGTALLNACNKAPEPPTAMPSAMPAPAEPPVVASAASAAAIGPGATAAAPHPLDGLNADEITAVVKILRDAKLADDKSFFPLIELFEPEKSAVLAWKEGDPLVRRAYVNFKGLQGTQEALVNIGTARVEQVGRLSGEPMILLEEFMGSMNTALADAGFVAALARRGFKPPDVFCLPLTAGNFLQQAEKGRRLMKVPCYQNPSGSNYYAKPIEGLLAEVDLNTRKVTRIVDEGVLPMAKDDWGYTQGEFARRAQLRPVGNPVEMTQSKPNFSIDGSRIEWDMWRMRYRADKRPGIVLSAIQARDGATWRSVLYQAHLSEVFVPYQDPSQGWYWRTYMDSGEYGFGVFLSPLVPGMDCPRHATFLPVTMHQDNGQPVQIPNAVCVFERAAGEPAWRHYEIFAQSEKQAVPAEGRAKTELVVRSASEVGNYDYLVDYVFGRNGSINIDLIATGLDAVKGVATRHLRDASAARDTRYGSLIAPHLVAPNHDHYFNFRLDFDIDGTDNTFVKTVLDRGKTVAGALRKSYWVANPQPIASEMEGRLRVDNGKPALYSVINSNREGVYGHHPGYAILPRDTATYGPYDYNDPPFKRNAYIGYSFWNTLYDPHQRYAGGKFAFASDGSDTLATWVKQNRPIKNKDIVTWYTIGFHHVPHTEDWPVMSGHKLGIELRPYNFFAFNPAMAIRSDAPAAGAQEKK